MAKYCTVANFTPIEAHSHYLYVVLFYVFVVLFYVLCCVVLCNFFVLFNVFLCCSIYCFFVTFPVLFVCICVLYYCHRVATQLQLNISYHGRPTFYGEGPHIRLWAGFAGRT